MNKLTGVINAININTNTLVIAFIAIICIYVVLKAVGGLIKLGAFIAVIYFGLLAFQSTNIINVPIVSQAYKVIQQVLPSKALWTQITSTVDTINKVNKALNSTDSTSSAK